MVEGMGFFDGETMPLSVSRTENNAFERFSD